MDVRLLGPVEVWVDDGVVELGPAKQRCVLAALAFRAGRPIPVDLLVSRVWGGTRPAEARNVVYSYIARLRKELRQVGVDIAKTGPGYLLVAAPEQVDLHRFVANGHRSAPPGILDLALREWRGEPLDGLAGEWVERVRVGLHRRHVGLLAAWARAALDEGRAAEVVRRCGDALDDYPDAEPLVAAFLRGLHAEGRTAEALERYEVHRCRLVADVGAAPAPELRELHLRLLRGPAGSTPASATTPATTSAIRPATTSAATSATRPATTPAQLPAAPRGFAGRAEELRRLDGGTGPVVVTGLAGIGKTALALTWAHRAARRFPDGQLYADLHGHPAAAILPRFLRALGEPSRDVPPDLAAATVRYRELMAARRVLVLLDNVADATQVRSLLPPTPGCLAVVTGADRLAELPGDRIRLGPLSPADAVAVLAGQLGTARIAADLDGAHELARVCDHLPLALRIAAARLLDHPGAGLADYARELRDGDPLGELETEDASVRAAFERSYRRLPEEQRRLFRRLGGLPPGTPCTAHLAAALAGVEVTQARRILTALAHAGLVEQRGRHRFELLDLVRRYAADVRASEPAGVG